MLPDIHTDVAVIGAGTAGLYVLREIRRARRSFVLIDQGPLGTTCARVGCMPSKVALHAGGLWAARADMARMGVGGTGRLELDTARIWAALRAQRDQFSGSAADKARSAAGEFLLEGRARFIEPTLLAVDTANGLQRIRATSVVIATGSRPVRPAWLDPVREHVVSTDELFELDALPASIGILGLGAIGLEMGLALSRLGIEVVGADLADSVAGIADSAVSERALATFSRQMALWLGVPVSVSRGGRGVVVRSGERSAEVDLLLAALGRRPNTDGLGLVEAGFPLDQRGAPVFDSSTLQIGDLPVFIAGDANGERPLMHEAADEGAIAGYNASRPAPMRFARKVALGIAFSSPDVAAVGARLSQLDADEIVIGTASGEGNGRARILHAQDGLLRVYADRRDGRLLGAAMVTAGGEHLAHLLAWAIQRKETARGLLALPFYHPVIEEMLQSALQDIVRQLPQTSAGDAIPAGLVPESGGRAA
ncbi:dihydrolipoyl dehydrogenase [Thauera linaloolentis]|uniref:Pyridine nucleotide-disulfide oxidoreductase dimerization region n=1 Tax=Thauera linaloolentis (strain DSM 12138 / JCM 21573 / CCUG 41526 / CIP 105981 / IAM 15112 / NBRC 102519 / 47Lol) TaxID=1123367 RepID=N6Z785_THAL4|nr:dihydrolipoyl dehydrogenase [Thauera linaloolentis]ENO90228.1 pyridine nucleotide-disulfide oxidoreductase dimerization region [Thauera linaloolentis 47Lol = DSM 12138]MCM8566281.1 dihydrolipoyl dehydrogenase [Thauera linaloolentis]